MSATHDPDGARVRDLVARCLERLEEGPRIVDEICRSVPTLRPQVERRLAVLRRVGLLQPSLNTPIRIGDFHLLARIGGGARGVVHAAEQISRRRRVALRLLRPELLRGAELLGDTLEGGDAAVRERTAAFAAAAALCHPAIAPLVAWGEEQGILFCATEWIAGASLRELLTLLSPDPGPSAGERLRAALLGQRALRRTPWTFDAAAAEPVADADASPFAATAWDDVVDRVLGPVASALAAAHRRQVFHGDLRSSNVFVAETGRVVVVDFGLAAPNATAADDRHALHDLERLLRARGR